MMMVVMVLMIMIGGWSWWCPWPQVKVVRVVPKPSPECPCSTVLAGSRILSRISTDYLLITTPLKPAPAHRITSKVRPLQFVKICGHKYRGIGQKYKKLAPQIQSGLLCAIVRPWPTSFPALRGAELDFLKILAKISCLISQIPA